MIDAELRPPARDQSKRPSGARPAAVDPILEDLRTYAHDLGIAGTGAMSKTEIVETLRQRYVLQTLLKGAGAVGAGA